MVGQLAAERALDDRLLETPDRGIQLLRRNRPLTNELVENLRRDRRQWRLGRSLGLAVHSYSSCYAPHTKFLTLSLAPSNEQSALSAEHREPRTEH